jgi:pimeloyl-ACP methyl ester carboxylesterase
MTPLFVSGWAGCECIYPQLARDCRMLIPFLRHEEPEIARILHQGGGTLLGWSTGAHMILKLFPDILRKFERIILAGPFLSFTRYVPKARLEAMIRAMSKNPERTVAGFMAKCGYCGPLSISRPDHPALVRGLSFLLTSEASITEPLSAEQVTLVHGARDRIVPVQASLDLHALLPGSALLLPDQGHQIEESFLLELLA